MAIREVAHKEEFVRNLWDQMDKTHRAGLILGIITRDLNHIGYLMEPGTHWALANLEFRRLPPSVFERLLVHVGKKGFPNDLFLSVE